MASQLPRSRRGQVVPLREGVDIALAYFNGEEESIAVLTARAKKWAARYFQGFNYASKPSTALLREFPNLFNLGVEAHLRTVAAAMPATTTTTTEPEGASPSELRRLERASMNSEPFPQYVEPLLATDDEIVQLTGSRPRHVPGSKPSTAQVDASTLLESGLLHSLPEFLGQLARGNFDKKTRLTKDMQSVSGTVDETIAGDKDGNTALVATQKSRNWRRHLLTGGRPFKLPTDDDEDGDDEDSENESEVSSSTTASLMANLKKRKAREMSGSEDTGPPMANKIRLHRNYPTPVIEYFDLEKGEWAHRANPDALPDDPWMALHQERRKDKLAKSASSTPAANRRRAMVPIHTLKIRVPSIPASDNDSSSSSTSDSKVIVLKDPRTSPTASSPPALLSTSTARPVPSVSNASSSSSGVRRIKVIPPGSSRRTSPLATTIKDARKSSLLSVISSSSRGAKRVRSDSAVADVEDAHHSPPASEYSAASSSGRIKRIKVIPPGTGSSPRATDVPDLTTGPTSSASSTSSRSSGKSKVTRIKVVNRMSVNKMTLPERKKEAMQIAADKVEEYLKTL